MVWLFSLLLALTAAVLAAALPESGSKFKFIVLSTDDNITNSYSLNKLNIGNMELVGSRSFEYYDSLPGYLHTVYGYHEDISGKHYNSIIFNYLSNFNKLKLYPITSINRNILFPGLTIISDTGNFKHIYSLPRVETNYTFNGEPYILLKASLSNQYYDFNDISIRELDVLYRDIASGIINLWENDLSLSNNIDVDECIILASYKSSTRNPTYPRMYRAYFAINPNCVKQGATDDIKNANAHALMKYMKSLMEFNSDTSRFMGVFTNLGFNSLYTDAPEWSRFYSGLKINIVRNKGFKFSNISPQDLGPFNYSSISDVGLSLNDSIRKLSLYGLTAIFSCMESTDISVVIPPNVRADCIAETAEIGLSSNSIDERLTYLRDIYENGLPMLNNIVIPNLIHRRPSGIISCSFFKKEQKNYPVFNLTHSYPFDTFEGLKGIANDLLELSKHNIFYNIFDNPIYRLLINLDDRMKIILNSKDLEQYSLDMEENEAYKDYYRKRIVPLTIVYLYLHMRKAVRNFKLSKMLKDQISFSIKERSMNKIDLVNHIISYLSEDEIECLQKLLNFDDETINVIQGENAIYSIESSIRNSRICSAFDLEKQTKCRIFYSLFDNPPNYAINNHFFNAPILNLDYAIILSLKLDKFYNDKTINFKPVLSQAISGKLVLSIFRIPTHTDEIPRISDRLFSVAESASELREYGILPLYPTNADVGHILFSFIPILYDKLIFDASDDDEYFKFINHLYITSDSTKPAFSRIGLDKNRDTFELEKASIASTLSYLKTLTTTTRIQSRNLPLKEDEFPSIDMIQSCIDENIYMAIPEICSKGYLENYPTLSEIVQVVGAENRYITLDDYVENYKQNVKGNPDVCAVCLFDYEETPEMLITKECSHAWHAKCLRTSKRCPMCKLERNLD